MLWRELTGGAVVIFGNHKYEIVEVARDGCTSRVVRSRKKHFWHCVVTGKQPVAIEPPPPHRNLSAIARSAWMATMPGVARS
jgi:hypothetical protein